jgi:mannonate dehydratase
MRMFLDRQYESTLLADISTLTQTHHGSGPLRETLKAPELHDRLLYATDYPLPALRFVISPAKLQLAGFLTAAQSKLCRELFEYNPLLFDFAVARSVRYEDSGRTYRFSPQVFETARFFEGTPS